MEQETKKFFAHVTFWWTWAAFTIIQNVDMITIKGNPDIDGTDENVNYPSSKGSSLGHAIWILLLYFSALKTLSSHVDFSRGFAHTLSTLRPEKKPTTPMSSAGLVYNHYGHAIICKILNCKIKDEKVDKIFDIVYKNFIEEIDAADNAISICDNLKDHKFKVTTNLTCRVSKLNRWDDKESCDAAFEKAQQMTGEEFLQHIRYLGDIWWPTKELLLKDLNKRFQVDKSGMILELSKGCPWEKHLFSLEVNGEVKKYDVCFVIFPKPSGNWRIVAVGIGPVHGKHRQLFPKEWRGLTSPELEAVSGIPGSIFVHANGHLGEHQTRDGVIEMARKSLKDPSPELQLLRAVGKRQLLHAELGMLQNSELQEKSGLPGIKFVDPSRSWGRHETREGAIQMAKKSLMDAEPRLLLLRALDSRFLMDSSREVLVLPSKFFPARTHFPWECFFKLEEEGVIAKNEVVFVIFTDSTGLWIVMGVSRHGQSQRGSMEEIPLHLVYGQVRIVHTNEGEEKAIGGLPRGAIGGVDPYHMQLRNTSDRTYHVLKKHSKEEEPSDRTTCPWASRAGKVSNCASFVKVRVEMDDRIPADSFSIEFPLELSSGFRCVLVEFGIKANNSNSHINTQSFLANFPGKCPIGLRRVQYNTVRRGLRDPDRERKRRCDPLGWKRRLQSWIDAARRDLSTLQEIKKGNTSRKVKLTYKRLCPKCKITSDADLPTHHRRSEDEDPSLEQLAS
ncbi:unnamed protein product [Darwinula stevensoni]|uniref:Uncharacterized protein n=1 Tax=Darwinula stevensoni TaxID=69355 RepID=A0A7R8XEE6_9CRUS|nr:unnamed protein product [Darwinula stevensoni]CAG0889609.1 unnamed protein product [Darwinula stevensoni]